MVWILKEYMNWKSHTKQNELSRSISVLSKAKHIVDHKALHILDCSMVFYHVYNTVQEFWANTENYTAKKSHNNS